MPIRAEREEDRATIAAVNDAAFESTAESGIVAALREQARPFISLVAEDEGRIVGHITFAPVVLPDHPELYIMGLAPMAVLPGHQCKGIGSDLVHAGLRECDRLGFGAVVVLGHPDYYPRFGFTPAARFGIGCEYEAPEEAFMLIELRSGYLAGASGTIRYPAAFNDV